MALYKYYVIIIRNNSPFILQGSSTYVFYFSYISIIFFIAFLLILFLCIKQWIENIIFKLTLRNLCTYAHMSLTNTYILRKIFIFYLLYYSYLFIFITLYYYYYYYMHAVSTSIFIGETSMIFLHTCYSCNCIYAITIGCF